jgi:hypothetical protein
VGGILFLEEDLRELNSEVASEADGSVILMSLLVISVPCSSFSPVTLGSTSVTVTLCGSFVDLLTLSHLLSFTFLIALLSIHRLLSFSIITSG